MLSQHKVKNYFLTFFYSAAFLASASLLVSCGPESEKASGEEGGVTESVIEGVELSSLTVTGIDLDQVFQRSNGFYTASAHYLDDALSITPWLEDSTHNLAINGVYVSNGETYVIALTEGENQVTISVTSEEDTTSLYTIEISRDTASEIDVQQILSASDATYGHSFGLSIAIDEDTMVVGTAPMPEVLESGLTGYRGAAYVYVREGGQWIEQQKLLEPEVTISDVASSAFGSSVAIDGDTILVGAYGHDISKGAVYAYSRSNSVWAFDQQIMASDSVDGYNDYFGDSIAIEGNTAVIGATIEDSESNGLGNLLTGSGAAYVFTLADGVWTEQIKLKAEDAQISGAFGHSVDIHNGVIIVGARDAHTESANGTIEETGAVYVFTGSENSWVQQQKLTADDGVTGDVFGYSVAIDGDTIVASAINADVDSADGDSFIESAGAIYIYNYAEDTWLQRRKLKAEDAQSDDRFGNDVDIEGDTIVVGAPFNDDIGANSGSAYLFTIEDDVWTQQTKFIADDGEAEHRFGYTSVISGNTLFFGSINANTTDTNTGAVYIWQ